MDLDFGGNFGSSKGLQGSVRRIPTFAGSQYGTLDTPITFTGDFEAEAVFSTTSSAVPAIFGAAASNTTLLYVQADGRMQARFSSGAGIISTTVVNDGKVHTALMRRTGSNIFLFIDGVQEATSSEPVLDSVIDLIGNNQFSLLWEGQILSVKFTDQSGSPDVVINYVFDSGSDLYQLPRGEGLGNDLVVNSDFSDGLTGWTTSNATVLDGEVTFGVGGGLIFQDIAVISGRSIFTAYDVTGVSVPQTPSGLSVPATTLSPTVARIQFNGAEGTTVRSASLQQLPALSCTLTNFATTDWNRYTQQRNIQHDAGVIGEAWVGDNLLDFPSDFSNAIWTKAAGASVTGTNFVVFDGTINGRIQQPQTTNFALLATTILRLDAGAVIDSDVSFAMLGNFAASNSIFIGDDLSSEFTTIASKAVTNAAGLTTIQIRCDAAATLEISNMKLQHLLEVAA